MASTGPANRSTADQRRNERAGAQPESDSKQFTISAPTISLPKGGGAIRGIGEKFAANPVTGTGSMSVPIIASPGRSGFGPQLSLSYDSGAGQGPFGLGWSLSLPSITRKTDRGLPQYLDEIDSDTFLLAGAEDLVPVLDPATGLRPNDNTVQVYGRQYLIRRYRPRIEGLFARIERWQDKVDRTNVFWRTISRDNVTSWFGRTAESRVFDPDHPSHVFQWMLCEHYDDKGNVVVYRYKPEDGTGVDRTLPFEANRPTRTGQRLHAATHIDRILYGNRTPYLPALSPSGSAWMAPPLDDADAWMFELLFDYGQYPVATGPQQPELTATGAWSVRKDPFSSHRAGFEVRTWRLCRRVLMRHHFPGEPTAGARCLVKSTDFDYGVTGPSDLQNPAQSGYTTLRAITHRSYQRRSASATSYEWRDVPPVNFTYSQPSIGTTVQRIAAHELPNLPAGTQGAGYQWVDLDGEGMSGVLTEQAGAWHYAANRGEGRFAPSRVVAPMPALAALAGGSQQLMDLAGDGEIELVDFSGPTPGFHERDRDEGWKRHVPFASLPNIDWQDPNLRFLDLTGDGHADALVTEHEVFTWYASLEERGFALATRTHTAYDDDAGPRLVFDDGTQTLFLADMCGDGLTDLVRIRNGQVCYWPNVGYGRFGRKVTLANAPRFDAPDLFDPARIRLADIDGSGPTDIIYLGRSGAQLYFNRSGNSLSNARLVPMPLATANLGAVQVADLLGTGTACLVWNSHLPADASHPVRYVDLMADGKPHLLVRVVNNLGGRTEIAYTPSTRFYLDDLVAGTPWVTRLPFPVHCVSKVTVHDAWRGTAFSSTYSYHHGFFDGREREFRGFGRVVQIDLDAYGSDDNVASPWVTDDRRLFQPPVKKVTWHHTGVAAERDGVLSQFAREYFPQRYARRLPTGASAFREKPLPEPELPPNLTTHEWHEALRACKGMVLRQEIYELDLDELVGPAHRQREVRLYSVATHNCQIQRLQPIGANRHAVFLVTESEAITYHHELTIPPGTAPLAPDPRISHTLNLRHDEYGHAEQVVTVGYPRWAAPDHAGLPRPELIRQVQAELHLAYSETRHTNDVLLTAAAGPAPAVPALRHYRLRLPYEVRTYEITGIAQPAGFYFDLETLRRYQLSEDAMRFPASGGSGAPRAVGHLEYHQQPQTTAAHRRQVERVRTLYFNDASDGVPPTQALPLSQLGPRALKFEDYKLALTRSLLDAVLGAKLDEVARPGSAGSPDLRCRDMLNDPASSGYVRGDAPGLLGSADEYWIRSGIAGFATDAHRHFYLPERFTDAFGHTTTLRFDPLDLYIRKSTDARANTTALERFDCRVLAPVEMVDINGNHIEVAHDIIGMVVAMARKGKRVGGAWELDDLEGLTFDKINPPAADVQGFATVEDFQRVHEDRARDWLVRATTRFVYHFGGPYDDEGKPLPNARMASACAIQRETHAGKLPLNGQYLLQIALECSDGSGAVLMQKAQAEPDPATPNRRRWLVNGLTLLNNKGKPVKQYEPTFSDRFGCELPQANGVSTTLFYDAAGRVVRTEMPDGTFSWMEFSPWFSRSFDANDTVLESRWYREKGRNARPPNAQMPPPSVLGRPPWTADERAGWLAAQHANTPAEIHFDSLGREVIAIAHNRTPDAGGQWRDEKFLTYKKLDAEGKPLWIRDARSNLVMQYITPPKPARLADDTDGEAPWLTDAATRSRVHYVPCYDLAGNLLHQHSMDAGDRWMLMDAAGKPMLAWDQNDKGLGTAMQRRLYRTTYDALHRPVAQWLKLESAAPALIEAFEYEDTFRFAIVDVDGNWTITNQTGFDRVRARNVLGQAVRHRDPSGLAWVEHIDFSGQPAHITRRLIRADAPRADGLVDWKAGDTLLEPAAETFHQITDFDALGRMTRLFNWHRDLTFDANGGARFTSGETNRVAVYVPAYNARGLLQSEVLHVRASKRTVDGVVELQPSVEPSRSARAIEGITYNAKGQRLELRLGNGSTTTTYAYDDQTFRLTQLTTRRTSDNKALQKLAYVYDAVGNITHLHDEAQETVYHHNAVIRPEHDYRYDALYRLIEATGRENSWAPSPPPRSEGRWPQGAIPTDHIPRNYTQRYLYDAVGNFVRMDHRADNNVEWTRHYTTQPDSNRLASTWYASKPLEAVTYLHDAHGSMLNLNRVNVAPPVDPDEDWGRRIEWDWRDMIHRFDAIGGGVAQYHYGINKQRTRKHIVRQGGIVEDRIYLGGYEVYRRRNSSGEVVEEIESHHLFEGEQRALLVDDVIRAREQPGLSGVSLREYACWRYQVSNHLGSVGLELDEAARVISYEEFHPYGTLAYRLMNDDVAVRAPAKRYRLTGMERDEESGLGYHTARYMQPGLAQWLSCDPIGIRDGINVYRYAKDNPVANADPGGAQSVGTMRDLAAVARRDLNQKIGLLSDMARHPQKYPNVSEAAKQALRAEVSALERTASGWEQRADEHTDFHKRVGLPVIGAAGALAVGAPTVGVAFGGAALLSTLAGGAGVGASLSSGRQVAQMVDGTRTSVSGLEVLEGAGWGGAMAPAAVGYAPVRIGMVVSGVGSGASELSKGHVATGAFDIATAAVPAVASRLAPRPGGNSSNTGAERGGAIVPRFATLEEAMAHAKALSLANKTLSPHVAHLKRFSKQFKLLEEWFEVSEGLGKPTLAGNAPGHTEAKGVSGSFKEGDVLIIESLGTPFGANVRTALQSCAQCSQAMSAAARDQGIFVIYSFINRPRSPDVLLFTPEEGRVPPGPGPWR